mmetsp:Transcript_24253/g.68787  ORF Transcript_24253/g.68787 Transcript_24253/m.68787 type:complete len:237 (+) Transcript_24253:64-774(+)|eukprot:CAMPEP_0177260784 /NCGR_PEP_ID=MMETSP0367-20130122/59455_1 /TAXON_ID=447022 ORGANISM="Scrippsiella hangoei-like, Strain SHHI-4" /NCGR_SAMPLE_ID=MMETSP0367 /ASSEMBLY_ACC=CAM_ASM_000362 /LENGTH=236 /DNA_ID=CAMNT_0018715349 /DNA_START=18 /DNA_END=728 /DNA_ORIENTATION=+
MSLLEVAAQARIVLIVGESGCGKTTWLTQQAALLRSAGQVVVGVLSPSRECDGRRCLQWVSTGELMCHQLNDLTDLAEQERAARRQLERQHMHGAMPNAPGVDCGCSTEAGSDTVVAGPFVFDAAKFAWARQDLVLNRDRPADWVLIDEVGPLELRRQAGLEPAVSECLGNRLLLPHTRFVIAVRPSLRELLMARYDISADECAVCVLGSGYELCLQPSTLERRVNESLDGGLLGA